MQKFNMLSETNSSKKWIQCHAHLITQNNYLLLGLVCINFCVQVPSAHTVFIFYKNEIILLIYLFSSRHI